MTSRPQYITQYHVMSCHVIPSFMSEGRGRGKVMNAYLLFIGPGYGLFHNGTEERHTISPYKKHFKDPLYNLNTAHGAQRRNKSQYRM